MQNYTNEDQELSPHPQPFPSEKVQQSLINDLAQTENPFSFYNKSFQRSNSETDQKSDEDVLDDITGIPVNHKLLCQAFSAKDAIQEIVNRDEYQIDNFNSDQKSHNEASINTVSPSPYKVEDIDSVGDQNIQNEQRIAQIISYKPSQFIESESEKLSNIPTGDQQILSVSEKIELAITSQLSIDPVDNIDLQKPAKPSIQFIGSQQQLEDDLKQLKGKFKGKKGKVSKKQVEMNINSNKTVISSPVKKAALKKQAVNSTHCDIKTSQEDVKMMYNLIGSKKKQNFKFLNEWDTKKDDSLDIHQGMVQLFLSEIDKRQQASKQNFQIFCSFFKQRASQQEKYANSPLIDTKMALKDNLVSKTLYLNSTVVLNTMSEDIRVKCKKIKDFVSLMKKDILQELMQKHSSQSQKELMVLRQKISTAKKSLVKCSDQVEATNSELQRIFKQFSTTPKDFYAAQIRYLRRSCREVSVQKKLGLLSLQFYNKSIEQENKRSFVIREALVTYSKGLKETYDVDMEKQEMEQMSKGQELKLIQQLYSFQQMFDDSFIKQFKKKSGMEFKKGSQIGFKDFISYLENYSVPKFDDRMAILKDFNVQYQAKDSKIQESCYLVITVDAFLHIFLNKQKKPAFSDPDISIQIFSKGVDLKVLGGQSVQIIKKQERKSSVISYFWDTKQEPSYRIIFSKRDAKEEFIDTVNKLIK